MAVNSATQKRILLVVDGTDNWYTIMKGAQLDDGSAVTVEQAKWRHLHLEASSLPGKSLVAFLDADEDPLPFSTQSEDRVVSPDFILFRNFPTDLHDNSFRNQVVAAVFSGVAGVNSPESVLQGMDRPIQYASMLRVSERVGREAFPLVPMKYHPNNLTGTKKRMIELEYPTVLKVGSTHAGFGKVVVRDRQTYYDIESILAMKNDYFTEEPFLDYEYEFRVQVIGPYIRCFRRNSDSSWKNNWGDLKFEDHSWDPKINNLRTVWIDEVRKCFGGLDMFALDVLHLKNGSDFIIEINDYAMGLDYTYQEEDWKRIREVILQRMNEKFAGAVRKNYLGVFQVEVQKRHQKSLK